MVSLKLNIFVINLLKTSGSLNSLDIWNAYKDNFSTFTRNEGAAGKTGFFQHVLLNSSTKNRSSVLTSTRYLTNSTRAFQTAVWGALTFSGQFNLTLLHLRCEHRRWQEQAPSVSGSRLFCSQSQEMGGMGAASLMQPRKANLEIIQQKHFHPRKRTAAAGTTMR